MGVFTSFVCIAYVRFFAEPRYRENRGARRTLCGLCDDRHDALADLCRIDAEPPSVHHGGQADARENQLSEGVDSGSRPVYGPNLDGDSNAAYFRRDARLGDRTGLELVAFAGLHSRLDRMRFCIWYGDGTRWGFVW